MAFQHEKYMVLNKMHDADKSRKGSVDKHVKRLLNIINNMDNFYTTSSCAGRIKLITDAKKPWQAEWHFVSHEPIKELQLPKKVPKNTWLRQEPLILHVACKTLEDANKILSIIKKVFKRSAIASINDRRVMLEIIGNDVMSAPITNNMNREYTGFLIKSANKKLKENFKKIKKLENLLEQCNKQDYSNNNQN